MRVHGSRPKYYHKIIGGNFRLDALQAAVLIVKFRHLDDWTEKRIANANWYRRLLHGVNPDELYLPPEKETRHIYNQFVIRLKTRRDAAKYIIRSPFTGRNAFDI